MKRILSFFAFILLVACQAQKEKLELNLSKGGIYTQNMSSSVSMVQTMDGQPVNMNMAINSKMTYKVIDIQNSIYEMEVRYENLIMKMSSPGGSMEFSSEKNDEKDIFSSILSGMKNKPFLVKMTTAGKINEVKNIEAIFSHIYEKFPQLTDTQKEQIQAQLMQAYGEKAFKSNLEMVTAIYSDSPVSKGDKWIIKNQLESGFAANMETEYKLTDVSNSYYLIAGNSKIKTEDKDAYVQTGGMSLKYDLAGTMTSEIKINKKNRWILEAKIKENIKGTAQIKGNPQMPDGMTVPMNMDCDMTISEK